MVRINSGLRRWYSEKVKLPAGRPISTNCERVSPSGLSRIGFISTEGARPAASAWTACARPISAPSGVTKELSAMFCDLKGATRRPACRNRRHSAVTIRLLPTDDAVPCTINVRAFIATYPAGILAFAGMKSWKRRGGPNAHGWQLAIAVMELRTRLDEAGGDRRIRRPMRMHIGGEQIRGAVTLDEFVAPSWTHHVHAFDGVGRGFERGVAKLMAAKVQAGR